MPKKGSNEAVFSSRVGIRRPAYTDTDGEGVSTEKVDLVRVITVNSDISIGDLRGQISAELSSKGIDSDSKRSKVYYATSTKNLKLQSVVDSCDLVNVLRKGTNDKIVHMTIGAQGAEYDPDEPPSNTQRSDEYRYPPKAPAQKSAKQAAKLNTDVAIKIKAFAEALYFDDGSPFRHGFSAYHFGMIQQAIKDRYDAKEEDLITDVATGVFPKLEDWPKYAPGGTWDTPEHNRFAMGVTLKPGKFMPKKGVIPSAATCSDQLAKEAREQRRDEGQAQQKSAGGAQTSDGAGGGTDMTQLLAQIAAGNQLMVNTIVSSKNAGSGGGGVVGAEQAMAKEAQDLTVKEKLKRKLSALLMERKDLLGAGFNGTDDIVRDLDEKYKKFKTRLNKVEEDEDAELFDNK